MNPLISIIIPVYNHAKVFKQTVASVLKQTYRPLEIIIVNDGSTDNFSEAVHCLPLKKGEREGVEASDFSFKFFNQENKGAPAARNRGLSEAGGEYVIFWDADTMAESQMLEKMHRALLDNPAAAYAYSSFCFGCKKMLGQPFDADKLKQSNYIDTTSLIKRISWPSGGWDERLKRFQDWDLWLTMLEQNKTGVFVPEILYKKIVGGRRGYSRWLPSFIYKLPWKIKAVKEYEAAREIVLKKHNLK